MNELKPCHGNAFKHGVCTNDLQKLRKCPFCGGEATGYEWSDDDEIDEGEPHLQDAYCAVAVDHKDDCLLKVGEFYVWIASTEKEAAEIWNKRVERTCKMKKARWDDGQCTWGVICSACGEKHEHEFEYSFNFCPTCGAKVVEP